MATCGSAEHRRAKVPGRNPDRSGEASGCAARGAPMTFRPRPQLTGESKTRENDQNATEQALKPREDMMTHRLKPRLLSIALLCTLGSRGHAQNTPGVVPPGCQKNPAQPTPAGTPRSTRGL